MNYKEENSRTQRTAVVWSTCIANDAIHRSYNQRQQQRSNLLQQRKVWATSFRISLNWGPKIPPNLLPKLAGVYYTGAAPRPGDPRIAGAAAC